MPEHQRRNAMQYQIQYKQSHCLISHPLKEKESS